MTAEDRDPPPKDERAALAGELALGLAPGREAAIRNDPALAAEVEQWERDLARFADEVQPSPPDPRLWRRLEAAIDGEAAPRAKGLRSRAAQGLPGRLAASLVLWRSLAGFGLAAAALLAALMLRGPDIPPPDPGQAPAIAGVVLVAPLLPREGPPAYVATFDAARSTIFAVPAAIRVEPGRFPQLWLVFSDADEPVALGILDPGRPQAIRLTPAKAKLISASSSLVITLEPGASVEEGASGPVIAHGVFTRF